MTRQTLIIATLAISIGCSGGGVTAPPVTDDGMKDVTLTLHAIDGISTVYQPCLAFGLPGAPDGEWREIPEFVTIPLGRLAVGAPIVVRQVFGQQLESWNGFSQQCFFSATVTFESTIGSVSSSCHTPNRVEHPPQLKCTVSIDAVVPDGDQVPPQ